MKKSIRVLFLKILWSAAGRRIKRDQPRVIAITGSVGKTSTKEVVAAVLEKAGKTVVKTAGNLSTDMGVPLSLIGYSEAPSGLGGWMKVLAKSIFYIPRRSKKPVYYVVEYSADKPGDIAYLVNMLPPDIALITKIVPVHMSAYDSLEELVKEKLSLLESRVKKPIAILNNDDPHQNSYDSEKTTIWYGVRDRIIKKNGVWAHDISLHENGLFCQLGIMTKNGMDTIAKQSTRLTPLQTQLFGKHQLYGLLAATAIAVQEKIPVKKIIEALESITMPAGRGRLIEAQKDSLIIDDTYNASPESVKAGIEMAKEVSKIKKRRLVTILGTMNELGNEAPTYHKEIAEFVAKKSDYVIFVGTYSDMMLKAAKEVGLPSHKGIGFKKPEQLIKSLDQLVKSKDLIYIKGSQNGMKLERVVKKLMKHPEQAEKLLVRQSAYWRQNP